MRRHARAWAPTTVLPVLYVAARMVTVPLHKNSLSKSCYPRQTRPEQVRSREQAADRGRGKAGGSTEQDVGGAGGGLALTCKGSALTYQGLILTCKGSALTCKGGGVRREGQEGGGSSRREEGGAGGGVLRLSWGTANVERSVLRSSWGPRT